MALMINGERVEDAEVEHVREQLAWQQAAMDGPPEWEARGIGLETFAKDMVVARILVKQEAAKREVGIPGPEVARELKRIKEQHGGEKGFGEYLSENGLTEAEVRADVELTMRLDRLLDEVCKDVPEPTDEDLRAHYEARKGSFDNPEQVHAGHIVKHVQGTVLDVQAAHSELEGVLEQLKEGRSFEALAREHSDCPENGGDLGRFARGSMVPEFEEVVFGLAPGETSGIFESPFGLHIAKLYERIPCETRPFEAVAEDVRDAWRAAQENVLIDAFTDSLKAQATIEEQ